MNDELEYEFGRDKDDEKKEEEVTEKEEPCFEPSGILAEFQNQYKGVTLKIHSTAGCS